MTNLETKLDNLYTATLKNGKETVRTDKLISILTKICVSEEAKEELKLLKIFKAYGIVSTGHNNCNQMSEYMRKAESRIWG